LSLKPICSTPFPFQNIYKKALSGALGKAYSYQDIIIVILSKQDKLLMDLPRLIKRFIGKIMLQGGWRDENTVFEISGHVQMAKIYPKAQTKSSLSDCTWLER
jgi:hypothetical protein